MDIERVQNAFLHLAVGDGYRDYSSALKMCNLDTLENRRTILCTNFAQKSAKHPKHKYWFEPNQNAPGTQSLKPKYKLSLNRLERIKNSPIPYLTSLLNS